MDLTVERLFASPDHYLFAFEGDQAVFRTMDRGAYHRSIFLDHRIAAADDKELRVPVATLTAFRDSRGIAAPRTAWIFHVAHCGSTLLARALDRPDGQPRPARAAAVASARPDPRSGGDAWRARLRLAAALAGRRYRPDAPTIVKANVPVNFIAADLLALDPSAPAILLYFPLRAYLLAVLRSPAHRQWVVNVTTQLDIAGVAGLDVAERAAALWLAQMRLYAELLAHYPGRAKPACRRIARRAPPGARRRGRAFRGRCRSRRGRASCDLFQGPGSGVRQCGAAPPARGQRGTARPRNRTRAALGGRPAASRSVSTARSSAPARRSSTTEKKRPPRGSRFSSVAAPNDQRE